MATKRRGIVVRVAQRVAAAIAQDTAPVAPTPALVPEAQTPAEVAGKAKAARVKKADERKVFGIYLTTETYQAMKAAYLADWSNRRGAAETLNLWVETAVQTHAARTPSQRASLALDRERGESASASRPFKIDPDVYARMQHAIGQDEQAGRWLSDSAWSVEALTAAVDAAKEANGGSLPTPPDRLPSKLKRRD